MTILPPSAKRYCPASTDQPAGSTAQNTGQPTASAMAVKKSFVSALPLQLAAAVPPPARGVAVAANEGEDAAADGEGLSTVATTVGLTTVAAGLATADGIVGL